MSECSYQVRSYKIKHNYDVKGFLKAYRWLLQRAINETWKNITWKERVIINRRRSIPIIPKSSEFKRNLRNSLLGDWDFCAHYADSAIKQAYSILKSWRRNYLKGRRTRAKPVVKKKFVRVKETLYSYRDGKIKISIKPYEEHLVFDVSNTWFWSRAKGEMGELILNEKFLIITFRFKQRAEEPGGAIAWDCNEKSLDGFNPEIGWIRVDLRKLFHIHRVYELKRRRLQSKASKKPSLRRVLEKYSRRERNRVRDFIHKVTRVIAEAFRGYVHGFEDIKKEKMFNKSRTHNRNVAKSDWRTIIGLMGYKSRVRLLSPYNSTRRCSSGMVNAPKGALYECKGCGLKIDRQLNACLNLYLQVEGLSPSPKLFVGLVRGWGGLP
ncbi:MAG: transposase [Candidatus Freyarchaeota archaeon]|nr:transposase [Candidatus Jordarchaeia archaeon]